MFFFCCYFYEHFYLLVIFSGFYIFTFLRHSGRSFVSKIFKRNVYHRRLNFLVLNLPALKCL